MGVDGELGTVLPCEFGLAINKLDAANFGKKAGVEDIRRYTALACVACFEMAYQIALKALDDNLGRALACKTEFWARCNEAYNAGSLEMRRLMAFQRLVMFLEPPLTGRSSAVRFRAHTLKMLQRISHALKREKNESQRSGIGE